MIEWINVILGSISFILSTGLLCFFAKSRHRIGKAFAFMLFGEAFTMLLAVSLSVVSLFDKLAWAEEHGLIAGVRVVMFIVVIASTIHLGVATFRILNDPD